MKRVLPFLLILTAVCGCKKEYSRKQAQPFTHYLASILSLPK